MGATDHYKAADFIKAMPGSAGIISTIAARVGCAWHTAKKYVDTYPTVRAAYDAEVERTVDLAESILLHNLTIIRKRQQDTGEPGDTSDAKWYLTRKGKGRGYTERQELTGAEGEQLQASVVVYVPDNGRNPEQ